MQPRYIALAERLERRESDQPLVGGDHPGDILARRRLAQEEGGDVKADLVCPFPRLGQASGRDVRVRHGCGLVSLEGRRHSLCLGGSGHTFHNEEVGRLGRRRLELLIEDAAAQVASQVHRCAHCGRALARLSQGVDCQLAEQRRELLPLAVRDAEPGDAIAHPGAAAVEVRLNLGQRQDVLRRAALKGREAGHGTRQVRVLAIGGPDGVV
mmetsp:Transcript_45693/g.147128  ORF Transcript_45693/g.147128 Transcript_45693/m.147128 type:complete len:211 (-) Transcript_45693:149-781(-)